MLMELNMIDLTKYKLILLMYCLEDSYELNHDEVLLADIEDIDKGEVHIYSVIHTDSKMKSLLKATTDIEVIDGLCAMYGLVKLDMELYKELKEKFDVGIIKN
jgi:hypothetical protein